MKTSVIQDCREVSNEVPSLAHEVVIRRSLSPQEQEQWDRFVLASSSSTAFHYSGWSRVVERILGHQSFYLFTRNNNGVTGIFPISHIRNPLFGDCLVSSPLSVYGGISANDEGSFRSLLNAAGDLARHLRVRFLEMRNRWEPFASELPGKDLYVTFTQDLTPGLDQLLKGLPRDTRYLVRKSAKAGLEWFEGLPVDQFYEIYAQSLHRLGTPAFPRALFSSLQEEFGTNCRIFGVRKENVVIAAVLCFYFKDQVLPYYAGALPQYYGDSPNVFMYWNLIAQSCREGVRHFDFGRSKRGTGSFQFKSSWGMTVTELPYRYQLVRAKAVPHMSPLDSKFKLPVAMWKRLPFSATKILGPRLMPWIPSA
jgi:FemAB-related protein (PEP-CTERM system-associated)